MNSPFDRWLSQEFAPLSPEQRGPQFSYHDLWAMVANPDLAHHMIEQHRRNHQVLSMAPGAVNELVREPERIVLDRVGRCQWCGGRVGNVTSCPNCGGPP